MQAEALLDHAAFVRELAKGLTFGGEDPDDVVQQTWLTAMKHPPEPGPGMKGWLATVLRNVLRQDRRSRGRRVAREAVAPPPKEMPTPDEIREREAVRSEVVTAVLDLDEPYRDVILMRYYEDLPPRKIAERTGDPVETVKTRLVRARGKLRERLDERHGGDGRTWGIAVASLALWPGEAGAAPVSGGAIPFVKIAAGLVAVVVAVVLTVTMLPSGSSDESGPAPVEAAEADRRSAPLAADREPGPKAVPEDAPAGDGQGEGTAVPSTGESPDDPGRNAGKSGTGASIEGRVLDIATKKPLPGATVRLVAITEPVLTVDQVTDEEGKYRFADLPVGVKVRVFIHGRKRIVRAGMFVPDRTLERGEAVRQDLTAIQRGGIDLRIHVRLPEGVAAPKVIKMTQTSKTGTGVHKFSSVDILKFKLDPDELVLTVFLSEGHHKLGFETDALRGELPPREVTGDGPPEDVVLTLEERTGIRLRLVDAEGKALRRGPVRMLVILHVRSSDGAGNTNFSTDSLGYHDTDERGELDLTPILPALNVKSMHGNGFAFALDSEGIFPGTMMNPNFEITVKDLLARQQTAAGGPVVIDVPALPHRVLTVEVRNEDGEPVPGVRVTGEPAAYFADTEYTSDADGRVAVRLVKAPDPFVRPPARPDRLVLVAKAPWTGRFDLSVLDLPDIPGAPPRHLVVRRVVEIAFRLLNDGGEPIAWTEVTVDEAKGKTDAAGVVKVPAAAGTKRVMVSVPGHLPQRTEPSVEGKEVTVRLVRAREIRVRVLLPDGTPTIYALVVKVPGEERTYFATCIDQDARVQTYLVPRLTVRVSTHPLNKMLTGSVDVGPDETEVELQLRKP